MTLVCLITYRLEYFENNFTADCRPHNGDRNTAVAPPGVYTVWTLFERVGSSSERFADVGYEPGDLGIVPRPHSRLPTQRDGMKLLLAAQENQAHALIGELTRKPTDPTTTTLVRVSDRSVLHLCLFVVDILLDREGGDVRGQRCSDRRNLCWIATMHFYTLPLICPRPVGWGV